MLKGQLQEALGIAEQDITCWTDEKTVLWWLGTQSRQLTTYVANQVESVLKRFSLPQWKWVPTDLNPTDLISRGMPLRDLQQSTLWSDGPSFLVDSATPHPYQDFECLNLHDPP